MVKQTVVLNFIPLKPTYVVIWISVWVSNWVKLAGFSFSCTSNFTVFLDRIKFHLFNS